MSNESWKGMELLIKTVPVQLDILFTLAYNETGDTAFLKPQLRPKLGQLLRIFCTLNAELRNDFKQQRGAPHLQPLQDLIASFTLERDAFSQGRSQVRDMIETEKTRIVQEYIMDYEKASQNLRDQLTKWVIRANLREYSGMYKTSSLDELTNSHVDSLCLFEKKEKSGKSWRLGGRASGPNVTKRMIPQWTVDVVQHRLGWFSFWFSSAGNLTSMYLFLPDFIRDALVERYDIDTVIEVEDTSPKKEEDRPPIILVREDIETETSQYTPLFTNEKELEDVLEENPFLIEYGMSCLGRQVNADTLGKIDLLMEASDGAIVVVELKNERAKRNVVAQIQAYLTWVKREYPDSKVRGVVVADGFSEQMQEALQACRFNVILLELHKIFTEMS